MRAEHIVLCGTAGAGKSTVGSIVARALQRPFVDIDREVERDAGTSVAELFARDGEAAFRARERAAVQRALARADAGVIALGGGALEHDDTFADVQRELLIWLSASIPTLVARCGSGASRPLLAGNPVARLTELAARREPRYRAAAITVPADGSAHRVARELLERLETRGATI